MDLCCLKTESRGLVSIWGLQNEGDWQVNVTDAVFVTLFEEANKSSLLRFRVRLAICLATGAVSGAGFYIHAWVCMVNFSDSLLHLNSSLFKLIEIGWGSGFIGFGLNYYTRWLFSSFSLFLPDDLPSPVVEYVFIFKLMLREFL